MTSILSPTFVMGIGILIIAAVIGSSLALVEASKGMTQILGIFLALMGMVIIGINLYHMVKPLANTSSKESTR